MVQMVIIIEIIMVKYTEGIILRIMKQHILESRKGRKCNFLILIRNSTSL